MKWNYRVVQNRFTTCYEILEVYYGHEGLPNGYVKPTVDDWAKRDDLQGTLQLMLAAFEKPDLVLHDDGTLTEPK